MSSFSRVLVATDGSESCASAVEAAVELARALGAELLALSIAHEPDASDADLSAASDPIGAAAEGTMAVMRDDEDIEEHRAVARARMVAEVAALAGVRARAISWEGPAGDAIVAAAAAEEADLIVVGSHCRGGIRRLVLGSVSDHVVRHSPVPVLIVRPTAPASRAAP